MATQTRAPTSDEAATGTWSGSAGSRWTLVDDYPSVATNDLLTGGTTAAVITFGFSAFSIPAGSTDISVQVQYFDGEPSNGANNCGGRIKVGGTYYNAATHNPAGTAGTSRSDNWATNPKTAAAWTVNDVNGVGANALQAFGMNSTDSNPTWRFSSIQAQVTYTAPVSRTANVATAAAAQVAAISTGAIVTGQVATVSGAQTAAMTGTVASSGVSADVATSGAAQTSAMTGAVIVSASVATSASAQTAAVVTGAVVTCAVSTSASAQVAAASGGPIVSCAIGASGSAQSTQMGTTVAVTAAIATLASAQSAAMSGSTTGAAPGVTANVATSASGQVWAADGSVVVVGNVSSSAGVQASSLGCAVGAVGGVPEITEPNLRDACVTGWARFNKDVRVEDAARIIAAELAATPNDPIAAVLRAEIASGRLSRNEDVQLERFRAWLLAFLDEN